MSSQQQEYSPTISTTSCPPGTWSIAEVCDWLSNTVLLPEYQEAFRSNEISGRELLQLTNEDLKDLEIGKVGHRKKILLEIQTLRNYQLQSSLSAASQLSSFSQQLQQHNSKKRKSPEDRHDSTHSEEEKEELSPSKKQRCCPHDNEQQEQEQQEQQEQQQDESITSSSSNKGKGKSLGNINCITCSICFEDKEGFKPTLCHNSEACEGVNFCADCLKTYVLENIKSRSFPLKCPNPKCGQEILPDDLQHLLTPEQMAVFYRNSFEHAVSTQSHSKTTKFLQCPTPDCKFIVSYEELNEDNSHFRCELCREHYCLQCRVPYHYGKTCVGYKKWRKLEGGGLDLNDALFFQYVESKHIQRCPACIRFVERRSGCNTISCVCGHMFCYGCGKDMNQCMCHLVPPRAPDYENGSDDEGEE